MSVLRASSYKKKYILGSQDFAHLNGHKLVHDKKPVKKVPNKLLRQDGKPVEQNLPHGAVTKYGLFGILLEEICIPNWSLQSVK